MVFGRDYDTGPAVYFRPRVQRPPFPESYPLQVDDPLGECLNLREEPGLAGVVIRCLPTGTRLSLAEEPKEYPWTRSADQFVWLVVETEAGEQGWVAINTGSITYAD